MGKFKARFLGHQLLKTGEEGVTHDPVCVGKTCDCYFGEEGEFGRFVGRVEFYEVRHHLPNIHYGCQTVLLVFFPLIKSLEKTMRLTRTLTLDLLQRPTQMPSKRIKIRRNQVGVLYPLRVQHDSHRLDQVVLVIQIACFVGYLG